MSNAKTKNNLAAAHKRLDESQQERDDLTAAIDDLKAQLHDRERAVWSAQADLGRGRATLAQLDRAIADQDSTQKLLAAKRAALDGVQRELQGVRVLVEEARRDVLLADLDAARATLTDAARAIDGDLFNADRWAAIMQAYSNFEHVHRAAHDGESTTLHPLAALERVLAERVAVLAAVIAANDTRPFPRRGHTSALVRTERAASMIAALGLE